MSQKKEKLLKCEKSQLMSKTPQYVVVELTQVWHTHTI